MNFEKGLNEGILFFSSAQNGVPNCVFAPKKIMFDG